MMSSKKFIPCACILADINIFMEANIPMKEIGILLKCSDRSM